MRSEQTVSRQRATTLVQLLIVIAIVAILVTTLMVGIGAVRRSARVTQSHANIEALDIGLSTFRKLTGDYPPSRSDHPTGHVASPYLDVQQNSEPVLEMPELLPPLGPDMEDGPNSDSGGGDVLPPERAPVGVPIIQTTGAQLLVWALAGADLLGPAGFKDLDHDGFWWDDTHADEGGLYQLDPNDKQPLRRRNGRLYDVNERTFAKSILHITDKDPPDKRFRPLFIDGFGFPVLYYKAERYATAMTTTDNCRGVYTQRDNAALTGTGTFPDVGRDLGAGAQHHLNQFIQIPTGRPDTFIVQEAQISPDPKNTPLGDPLYNNTFARFIWNDKVTLRNEPVNKDSFILISAGEDALYGTEDDVTNFPR